MAKPTDVKNGLNNLTNERVAGIIVERAHVPGDPLDDTPPGGVVAIDVEQRRAFAVYCHAEALAHAVGVCRCDRPPLF